VYRPGAVAAAAAVAMVELGVAVLNSWLPVSIAKQNSELLCTPFPLSSLPVNPRVVVLLRWFEVAAAPRIGEDRPWNLVQGAGVEEGPRH
jgi:hypothetical protein